MSSSDLIFIVGRPRSGTTVFRSLLEDCGGLNCHEVMTDNVEDEYSFYRFVAKWVSQDSKYVWPINHQELFPKYIDYLREVSGDKKLLLDLKYWGLNLIPVSEDVSSKKPFLIRFIQEQRAHAVQIVRKNKLRLILSDEILKKTGKWFQEVGDSSKTTKPKVEIDSECIISEIEQLECLDAEIRKLMAPLFGGKEICYEEMFDSNGNFSQKTLALAEELMGVPTASKTPRLKKMNPEPISVLVENFEELATAFAGSRHEWMLHDDG